MLCWMVTLLAVFLSRKRIETTQGCNSSDAGISWKPGLERGGNTHALMKPKEQNWHSHPPATVIHARLPPSGGTNVTGCGVSLGDGAVAATSSSGDMDVDDRAFRSESCSVDMLLRLNLRGTLSSKVLC